VLTYGGVELMGQNEKRPSQNREPGALDDLRHVGQRTVRVRTCNDHVLIVVADSPKRDAKADYRRNGMALIVLCPLSTAAGEYRILVPDAGRKEEAEGLIEIGWQQTPAQRGVIQHGYLVREDGGKAINYGREVESIPLSGIQFPTIENLTDYGHPHRMGIKPR